MLVSGSVIYDESQLDLLKLGTMEVDICGTYVRSYGVRILRRTTPIAPYLEPPYLGDINFMWFIQSHEKTFQSIYFQVMCSGKAPVAASLQWNESPRYSPSEDKLFIHSITTHLSHTTTAYTTILSRKYHRISWSGHFLLHCFCIWEDFWNTVNEKNLLTQLILVW